MFDRAGFDLIGWEEQARKAADTDMTLLADRELQAVVVSMERIRSLIDLTEAHGLAELERRGTCEEEFGHSTTTWLAHAARTSPRSAKAKVETANALRDLDDIGDAVADGRLSFDHASALASIANPRVRDQLAGCQDELIGLAADRSFRQWQTEVRRLVDLFDQDGPPPDDPTRNRLKFGETLDGITHLTGTMTADVALIVSTALETKADELFRQYTRDRTVDPTVVVPSRATLRMLALAALLSEGSTGRAEVTLFLRDHEYTDRHGNPVSQAAAGVWGCDPDLWAVLTDHMGIPLDLGHGPRFANDAIRRALALRDGGCTFPGCDRPPEHCDAHHTTSPLTGGTTDLNRMALLCRHHHRHLHTRHWTITPKGNGTFTWTNPTGQTWTTTPRAP